MAKLKLGPLLDDKPVKMTADLPADVHRDLLAAAAPAQSWLALAAL